MSNESKKPETPAPNDSEASELDNRAAAQRPGQARSPRSAAPGASGGTGAPPCNTAPANCIEEGVKVLRWGIDSLYVSEHEQRALAIYPYNDHIFQVSDKGKGRYKYLLRNHAYQIQVAGYGSTRLPLAHIQIRSEYLTSKGIKACCNEILDFSSSLGDTEGVIKSSRADLYCDFVSSLPFEQISVRDFVTRADYRPIHFKKNEFRGFSFGPGGDLVARWYDKTFEVIERPRDYLKQIWHKAGWNPDQAVQRLEFQFKRPKLTEHEIDTVSDLMKKLGPLWRYATQKWLKLTIPSQTDTTQSRWPVHPIWELLSGLEWQNDTGGTSKPVRNFNIPSDEKLFVFGLSTISSFMAREGITDPRQAFEEYYSQAKSYHLGKSFLTGTDMDGYLVEKAQNKARRFNVSWPGNKEKAQAQMNEAVAKAYANEKQTHDPGPWYDNDE